MADDFARDRVSLLQADLDVATNLLAPDHYSYSPQRTLEASASTSNLRSFRLGTGGSVFASALMPAMLAAKREIILVTCFWSPSSILDGLRTTLSRLADERRQTYSSATAVSDSGPERLRVRICFSSRTLMQKLLHTSSSEGYTYPPESWENQLGLPPAATLRNAGIDLSVKSLFFLPFSVMHPKLVIVDRQYAFLPSCNVSWEPWLEGCVEITGAAVGPLLSFYADTWGDHLPSLPDEAATDLRLPGVSNETSAASLVSISPTDIDGPGSVVIRFDTSSTIPTIVLPSSHHRNPHFHPFPWQKASLPPPTPLNLALLQLFASARKHIYLQTPNVTAAPAIDALLHALARGVSVTIVTCRGMMIYEQLITAGTTTECCLQHWIQRYEALLTSQRQTAGMLQIYYFQPFRSPPTDDEENVSRHPRLLQNMNEEPTQSHLKLLIVDGVHTVIGSGNMDRASWYTSQELGILFQDTTFAASAKTAVDRVLEGRLKAVYPS